MLHRDILTKLDAIHIEEALPVDVIIIVIGNLVCVLRLLKTLVSLSPPPVLAALLPAMTDHDHDGPGDGWRTWPAFPDLPAGA